MKAIIYKVLMILKHLFIHLRVVMTLCIGCKKENHSDTDCNSKLGAKEDSTRKENCDEK